MMEVMPLALGAMILALAGPGNGAPPNAERPQTSVREVPLGTLNIPDEVAPAVLPYLDCLYASHGIQMWSLDGKVRPPTVAEGSDCQPQRREAAARADRMLRNRSMGNTAQRHAFVEAVLTRIDNFASSVANPPSNAGGGDRPLSQVVPIGASIVPPVVAPFRRRYIDCFEDYVTSHVVDPASITVLRPAYDQALEACRDVRAREYAAALRAVESSREYRGSADGRALVDDAFRTADMSRSRFAEAYRREDQQQRQVPQGVKPETPTNENGGDAQDR